MKRFEVEVVKTDKYIIEFDENKFDEEWMKDWRNVFYPYYTLNDHAEHIGQFYALFGEKFIEGYGVPLINGKKPYFADEKEVEKGINIIIKSENIETDASEID